MIHGNVPTLEKARESDGLDLATAGLLIAQGREQPSREQRSKARTISRLARAMSRDWQPDVSRIEHLQRSGVLDGLEDRQAAALLVATTR